MKYPTLMDSNVIKHGPDAYPDLYLRCAFAFYMAGKAVEAGHSATILLILRGSETEFQHLHHVVVHLHDLNTPIDAYGDKADERCYRAHLEYELNTYGTELSVFDVEDIQCHPGNDLDDYFNTVVANWSIANPEMIEE